ncbi:MAG: cyclase [Anaerolineales bacterium]|nr:cyclase [Anaerolineales bacterium]
MASMLVHNKVKDYTAWREVYDSMADVRSSNGELSDRVYRDASDPTSVTIIIEWDSLESAQKYAQSSELKAAMERAGVEGPPDIHFLREV